jgi:hypothetical protein
MSSRNQTTDSRYAGLLLHPSPHFVHEVLVYLECVHDNEHHAILRPIRQIHCLGHEVVMNALTNALAKKSSHLQPCTRGDDGASTPSLKHRDYPLHNS